ncbi:MAG TPA: MFS transporter [Ktedonosporobacter sp.]|nr:MFS transporter [Ktedonosporobacter sp.]
MATVTSSRSLWLHAEFLKLWIGQCISGIGSAITTLALPLTAVVVLHATADQMGLLRAALTLPALLMSLFFGVWVDRLRRRPILIGADVGRMVLLGLIPLVAWLGLLRIEYLYIIGLLVGFLTVLFDIAITSFLPSLVQREALVEGNSKLQQSTSLISIVGPGVAGALIALVTAPMAIIVDALSFLASVISLLLMRTPEIKPVITRTRRSIWREIGEGLHALWQTPVLRDMTISSGIGAFFITLQETVFILFAIHDLKLTALQLGLIISSSGIASLVGATLVSGITRRLGPGPTIILGVLLTGLGAVLLALAGGPLTMALGLLVSGEILFGIGRPIYSVTQIALRQIMTPAHLLGRVNASRRFIVFGIMPPGALLGGVLGDYAGLRPTLAIGAAGVLLSFLYALCSLHQVRTFPQEMEQST